MKNDLRNKIYKIVTYHSDGGTSGYKLTEEEVNQIIEAFKEVLEGLKMGEVEARDYYGVSEIDFFNDGYNLGVELLNKKIDEVLESLE